MRLTNHLRSASSKTRPTCFVVCLAILSTALSVAYGQAPSISPSPVPGHNWERVKALPVHTRVHITMDHGGKTCSIFFVTDDILTCTKGNAAGSEIQRPQIQHIKLMHSARSALVGAAVGGGIGAGVGAIVGRVKPCPVGQTFCLNGLGIGAGGSAAIVGVAGALVGGMIGLTTDFTRGSSIYTRP